MFYPIRQRSMIVKCWPVDRTYRYMYALRRVFVITFLNLIVDNCMLFVSRQ